MYTNPQMLCIFATVDQDVPVEFVVMDKDVVQDDPIGVVYIDTSNLLLRCINGSDTTPHLEGWFPIYDTLEGVRGELRVDIKLDKYVRDANPSNIAKAGVVHFLAVSRLASKLYSSQYILGFVEELGTCRHPPRPFQLRSHLLCYVYLYLLALG